jgi:HK97 gp10 family phage protein
MISIESKLTGNLEADLDRFSDRIKGDILLSGVAAMAHVIYDEVRLNASPPRMGRKTGNLHESIYRVYAKDKSDGDTKIYRISWNKSKAPHGHLLEFGTSKAPAHPFVRPAFDHVQEAIAAGNARMAERLAGGGEVEP